MSGHSHLPRSVVTLPGNKSKDVRKSEAEGIGDPKPQPTSKQPREQIEDKLPVLFLLDGLIVVHFLVVPEDDDGNRERDANDENDGDVANSPEHMLHRIDRVLRPGGLIERVV